MAQIRTYSVVMIALVIHCVVYPANEGTPRLFLSQEDIGHLPDLLPKIPVGVENAARKFLDGERHLVQNMLGLKNVLGTNHQVNKRFANINDWLNKIGHANQSAVDYVIALPGTDYLLWIGGQVSRRDNYSAMLGREFGDEDASVQSEIARIPTHQIVSMATNAVLTRRAINQADLSAKLDVQPVYLIPIEPGGNKKLCDQDWAVISKPFAHESPATRAQLRARASMIKTVARRVGLSLSWVTLPASRTLWARARQQPTDSDPRIFPDRQHFDAWVRTALCTINYNIRHPYRIGYTGDGFQNKDDFQNEDVEQKDGECVVS